MHQIHFPCFIAADLATRFAHHHMHPHGNICPCWWLHCLSWCHLLNRRLAEIQAWRMDPLKHLPLFPWSRLIRSLYHLGPHPHFDYLWGPPHLAPWPSTSPPFKLAWSSTSPFPLSLAPFLSLEELLLVVFAFDLLGWPWLLAETLETPGPGAFGTGRKECRYVFSGAVHGIACTWYGSRSLFRSLGRPDGTDRRCLRWLRCVRSLDIYSPST